MEADRRRVILANVAAAVAALSAGVSVVATRYVVGDTDPVSLAFYRYAVAGLCMLPLLAVLWPKDGVARIEVGKIALCGAVFYAFFPWSFSAALDFTTGARGAIGLATIPIQTLIVAAIFGKELLSLRAILSVLLAFCGIASVFGPEALAADRPDLLKGDALMLLAGFSAALYSVFGRPTLMRNGPLFVTALAMVFGCLFLMPVAWSVNPDVFQPDFTVEGWVAVIFLGTLGGAIQFSLFTWALRWLPPSRTVIYLCLNPISAMALSAAVLGESVTTILLVGLVLVLSGVLVANLKPRANPDSKPPAADEAADPEGRAARRPAG